MRCPIDPNCPKRHAPRALALPAVLLLLAAAASGPAAELQPVADPDHVGVGGGKIAISESRPKRDITERRWGSRSPLYFALRLGDADAVYYGVVDESAGEGAGYDVIYVDTDGDDELGDESAIRPVREEVGRVLSLRTEPVRMSVKYRDGNRRGIAVRLAVSGFGEAGSGEVAWSAQCRVAELMRGEVSLGGTRRLTIAVLDRAGDSSAMNACFNDYGVDRLRIDLNGDGTLDAASEDFPLSKAIQVDGEFWELALDAAAGQVKLSPCTLPLGSVRVTVNTEGGISPTGTVEFVSDEGYAFTCSLPGAPVVRSPAGDYRIERATLLMRDAQRRTWTASFAMTDPVAVAGGDGETAVTLGRPFRVVPATEGEFKPGDCACVTAHLFGAGGEEYLNVAPLKMRMKPSVRIEDAMEIVVAEGRMEYG